MYAEYAKDQRMKLNVGTAAASHLPTTGATSRAHARDPLLAAGAPVPLLGRDRVGDNITSAPGRGAHADAVDVRQKRWLLACRLRTAIPAPLWIRVRLRVNIEAPAHPPRCCAGCIDSSPCAGASGVRLAARAVRYETADLRPRARVREDTVSASTTSPARQAVANLAPSRVAAEEMSGGRASTGRPMPYMLTLAPALFWFPDPAG